MHDDLPYVPDKTMISIDEASTIEEARELAPWAASIEEVDGGWMAFRLESDADEWRAQR